MRLWLAAVLIAIAPLAHAEQFVRQGGFIVHYAALKTTDLKAEVARTFNVQRSARLAFLVINAQRELEGGRTEPVPATAQGTARSLIGHEQKLDLHPVREGEVHYVVATFQAVDQEWLTLDLKVTPQGGPTIPVKFRQQFYVD